jgi:hypothetical protein
MPKGIFIALSNATSDDVDDDFNEWYDAVHAREMLALPGVRSFRRFGLAPAQVIPGDDVTKHRYLALYGVEADDWEAFAAENQQAFVDGRITIRPELIELDPMVLTMTFEEITPKTSA